MAAPDSVSVLLTVRTSSVITFLTFISASPGNRELLTKSFTAIFTAQNPKMAKRITKFGL
jgi:hypothetical protein